MFAGTACYFADAQGFFRKWVRDLMADQRGPDDTLVIAGGPGAQNPELIAPFVDWAPAPNRIAPPLFSCIEVEVGLETGLLIVRPPEDALPIRSVAAVIPSSSVSVRPSFPEVLEPRSIWRPV